MADSRKPLPCPCEIARARPTPPGHPPVRAARAGRRASLPEFTPGAHISVRVPNGEIAQIFALQRSRRARPLRHRGAARGRRPRRLGQHGRRGARGRRRSLIAEPRNDFPLVKSPAGYTFIAGGIGITPILSMMRHLKAQRRAELQALLLHAHEGADRLPRRAVGTGVSRPGRAPSRRRRSRQGARPVAGAGEAEGPSSIAAVRAG